MINAPLAVQQALENGGFRSADIIKINLGDAYDTGSDEILYLTNSPHAFQFEGVTWTPDHALKEIEGISRKASRGSDKVNIKFTIADENTVNAVRSERYINKPVEIRRVIFDTDGSVLSDFAIPVRTAWGLSHKISGEGDNRVVTLTTDSILGDLNDDNGWYCVNSSHMQRHANDFIMQHIGTTLTGEQAERYTTNYRGVIDNDVKPPAVPVIYGRCEAKPIPIMMLRHRKSHSTYRHYFTTFIYVVSAGEINGIKGGSIRKDGERFDYNYVTDNNFEYGGWSLRFRLPSENNISAHTDPKLNFWRQRLDSVETQRIVNMFGKGLTLMFVINRNRDDWIQAPPEFTVPIGGISVLDPRTGTDTPGITENPALQYYDYLRNTEYGAGGRGITVSEQSVIDLANHFDSLPGSDGNPGINSIKSNTIIDTAEPLVDNMNVWMETFRIFTSDYYGEFNLRVETISSSVWDINEIDTLEAPEFESGEFTERLNQLTYAIRQEVDDPSPDAPPTATMFVDVEATFPESGSTIHNDWLAEDAGIPNFDSKRLDNVTQLEQAFYWTMVDARISRQPRTLSMKLDERAWLLEAGDVVTFTSDIMNETLTEWRVDEINEDNDEDNPGVVVDCVAYANSFYSPDPNVIPDPVAPAQPPEPDSLSAISGFQLRFEDGLNKLDWTPLSSSDVAWYAVEIWIESWVVDVTPAASWSNSIADDAVPNGIPEIGDKVRQYDSAGSWSQTREYDGSNWVLTVNDSNRDEDDEDVQNRYRVIDNPKLIEPPMSLESLPAGDYYARVTAFRVGEEGNSNRHNFTLTSPPIPTLNITASNFELFIVPTITPQINEAQFELYISEDAIPDFETAERIGLSSGAFTITGRTPITTYNLWCRTVLPSGTSDYTFQTVTTTNDGTVYNNLLGFDVSDGKSVFSAFIYKRSPNSLPTPTGGDFNFDTLALTPPVGWSANVPAGNDPLYVSSGIASVNGTTGSDTDIPWSQPEILVQNGEASASGRSIYQAALYQRSPLVPSTPAPDSATYNFGTNEFDVLPAGWSETIVDGDDPVYVIYATFSIVGNTGTDSTQTWTSPVVFTQDGAPGESGISVYTFNLYLRSPSTPTLATGGSYDFGNNTVTPPSGGWSVNIPAGEDPIWVISTTASIQGDTGVDSSLTWTPPVQFVKNGADGVDGQDGKSVAVLTIYRRATTQPVTPTGGDYNFTNDILTPPLSWSAVPPGGSDPIYISTATASIIGTTGTDSTLPWSQPEIMAQNGETGKSVYQAALFRRATSTPATPADNSATFNFGTNTFDVLPSGWSPEVPAGDDPVYVTYATFNIQGDTGTDSTQSWTAPIKFTENGEGAVSTFTFQVYQRAASTPTTPTGGSYDFGTNAITAPTGWDAEVPEGDDPLYAASTTASVEGATGVDNSLTWTSPRKVAQDGENPVTGFALSPDGRFYRQQGTTWTPSTTIAQTFEFYRNGSLIASRTYEFRRVDGDGNLDVVLVASSGEATSESNLIDGALTGSVTVTHVDSGVAVTSGVESIPAGDRGAGTYSRDISPAVAWDDAEADLATPGDNVIGDTVTLYNETGGYVETRFWTGAAWTAASQIFDGDILFPGSVTAAKINVDDLFSKNITATGVIRYQNGNNLAELGGVGNLVNTQGSTGTIFRVTAAGGGILDGNILLTGTVPEGALSAAEINRLKDLIYPVADDVTETGGTLSDSFNTLGTTSNTLTGLVHGDNNVTLRFSGDAFWPTGVNPGSFSVAVNFQRRVNGGSWTTIDSNTVNGTVTYDSLGFWTVDWEANLTHVDSTAPNNVTLDYRVSIVPTSNFGQGNGATCQFSVEEPISQSGGSLTNALTLNGESGSYYLDWNNATNKPSPTITLTGDVTGSATMNSLGSVSINCTVAGGVGGVDDTWTTLGTPPTSVITGLNADKLDGEHASAFTKTSDNIAFSRLTGLPDPVITLSGDVTGTATMTNLGNVTINCTVDSSFETVAWTDITGKPTTFAPSAHTHSWSDLTGTPNVTGNLTVSGDITANGTYLIGDGKDIIRFSDGWVRINPSADFTSGIYCGNSVLRTDFQLQVGNGGSAFRASSSGTVTASGNITGADCIATSDRRVKKDLQRIENAFDKVCQITGYTYWRTDTDEISAGTIAQTWQKILPETVKETEAGLLTVSAQGQIGLIVEALKDIRKELDDIKKKID